MSYRPKAFTSTLTKIATTIDTITRYAAENPVCALSQSLATVTWASMASCVSTSRQKKIINKTTNKTNESEIDMLISLTTRTWCY